MTDFALSLIRTYVPIIVGAVVSWLFVTHGVAVSEDIQNQAVAALTGVVTALYYTVVRLVAKKVPALEWLLGADKTPTY